MKRFYWLVLLVLTGCVTTATQPGADSTERQRAKIHTELGSGYYAQGLLSVSLEEFNTSVRIDPSYAIAYAGLGLVYAALNEETKADANFKRALQLDPQSSETHNNYGTFLCARGRIEESLKEFMTAVRNPLYPTPELAYLNAGRCAFKGGDIKTAETHLNKALQLQPDLRQAHYQLASLHFSRDDFFQARQFLQRAMLNVEPTPDMLWLGVRIERQLGGSDAEASYRMLLKNKYPDSAQTKAMLSGE